jgi:hypothetical protein
MRLKLAAASSVETKHVPEFRLRSHGLTPLRLHSSTSILRLRLHKVGAYSLAFESITAITRMLVGSTSTT